MARKKAQASNSSANPDPSRNVVAEARGKAGRTGQSSATRENVRSILIAVLFFLVIRSFFLAGYRIPSGSMEPTLLIGDWLFVNKLRYGPVIPFTNVRLPGYAEPKRGEVVVFVSPYQADEAARGLDPLPTLVKRLEGVPGDTLFMREGVLHVNGEPKPQGPEFASNPVGNPDEVNPLFAWQLRYHVSGTRFGDPPSRPTHDHWGPLVVPPGHYFMLGDNRYESKDGRYWGLVPRENFRGRPLFVYFSWDRQNREIRWTRLGHWIR
ncbi:MAG: signal peptidase I [Actinobacteria bacterium]|nr:signal peptidase I [Actinomycetota bacterium]